MSPRVQQEDVDVALAAIAAGASWAEAMHRSGLSESTLARRLRTGGAPVPVARGDERVGLRELARDGRWFRPPGWRGWRHPPCGGGRTTTVWWC